MSLTLGPIFNAQNEKVREWSIIITLFNKKGEVVSIDSDVGHTDVEEGYYASYYTVSGYTNMKMTTSASTVIRIGKNVGRKNETNVLTQAYKECLSKKASKIKAGYSDTVKSTSSDMNIQLTPFPMAVKSWKDHKAKLVYPVFIQPKLDGIRMLATYDGDEVKLITRRLHAIVGFDLIKKDLKSMFVASGLKNIFIKVFWNYF